VALYLSLTILPIFYQLEIVKDTDKIYKEHILMFVH